MQDTMTKAKLASDIDLLQGKKVLVLGDIMLDRYQYGTVERISPEAPVPIVRIEEEEYRLGGACNVARNISTLGGNPYLLGICGQDYAGKKLEHILGNEKILTKLMQDKNWLTTVKTRVMAKGQQIARIDREMQKPPDEELRLEVKNSIQEIMPAYEVLIISDYGKGIINSDILNLVKEIASQSNIKVLIDPKLPNFELYHEPFLMTPNKKEAGAGAKIEVENIDKILEAGEIIKANNKCKNLLITMGAKGMILFNQDQKIWQIPTMSRKVYDVTGAGDTVIAIIGLTLSAGIDLLTCCVLANYAAGIVVGQIGTAAVKKDDLLKSIQTQSAPELKAI